MEKKAPCFCWVGLKESEPLPQKTNKKTESAESGQAEIAFTPEIDPSPRPLAWMACEASVSTASSSTGSCRCAATTWSCDKGLGVAFFCCLCDREGMRGLNLGIPLKQTTRHGLQGSFPHSLLSTSKLLGESPPKWGKKRLFSGPSTQEEAGIDSFSILLNHSLTTRSLFSLGFACFSAKRDPWTEWGSFPDTRDVCVCVLFLREVPPKWQAGIVQCWFPVKTTKEWVYPQKKHTQLVICGFRDWIPGLQTPIQPNGYLSNGVSGEMADVQTA